MRVSDVFIRWYLAEDRGTFSGKQWVYFAEGKLCIQESLRGWVDIAKEHYTSSLLAKRPIAISIKLHFGNYLSNYNIFSADL